MPFIASAKARIKKLPKTHRTRVILEILLKEAVGIENAKPWEAIEKKLRARNVRITLQSFQQTILKETRQDDIFIGSNDREPGKGYFIIKDFRDAETMQGFYERRIASENANLEKLKRLIRIQWPEK